MNSRIPLYSSATQPYKLLCIFRPIWYYGVGNCFRIRSINSTIPQILSRTRTNLHFIFLQYRRLRGINRIGGEPGVCTAGVYEGCTCLSICDDTDGACAANGCQGIQREDGKWRCTAGQYNGCSCESKCGNAILGFCMDN